jgi:hypothetical protein
MDSEFSMALIPSQAVVCAPLCGSRPAALATRKALPGPGSLLEAAFVAVVTVRVVAADGHGVTSSAAGARGGGAGPPAGRRCSRSGSSLPALAAPRVRRVRCPSNSSSVTDRHGE